MPLTRDAPELFFSSGLEKGSAAIEVFYKVGAEDLMSAMAFKSVNLVATPPRNGPWVFYRVAQFFPGQLLKNHRSCLADRGPHLALIVVAEVGDRRSYTKLWSHSEPATPLSNLTSLPPRGSLGGHGV